MSRRAPVRSSARIPIPAYGLLLLGLVSIGAGSLPAIAALSASAPDLATGTAARSAAPFVVTAALWGGGLVAALFGALLIAVGRR